MFRVVLPTVVGQPNSSFRLPLAKNVFVLAVVSLVIAEDAVIEVCGLLHVIYSLCASYQNFITVSPVILTVIRDI